MKQLVNPPINALFLLLGFLSLVWLLFDFIDLQDGKLNEEKNETLILIDLPSAETLAVPALKAFSNMMQTPLFWQERKIIVPQKKVVTETKAVVVINTDVPEGRLVGFIDTGSERFALVKDKEGSRRLREKDLWKGWTVDVLDPQKIILRQGTKKHALILVSSEAPKASSNKVANKRQSRGRGAKKRSVKQQKALSTGTTMREKQQSTVTMSPEKIEKMRAARHKLLQARWGKTENNAKNTQP